MDNRGSEGGGGLPTNAFLWLAIMAAGAILAPAIAWKASRPTAGEPGAYPSVYEQDVDARLWQDPLGALARSLAAGKPTAGAVPRSDSERLEQLRTHIREAVGRDERVILLGVMTLGGPYPDYAELRRRHRYAALAGLNAMGYVPADPEHIGYVTPLPGDAKPDRTSPEAQRAALLPRHVAYEWLTRPPNPADGETRATSVLTLWLDESLFSQDTVRRLDALVDLVRPDADAKGPTRATGPPWTMAVVGPLTSTTLKNLYAKPPAVDGKAWQPRGDTPIDVYAYGATAPLEAEAQAFAERQAAAKDRRVRVMRTIGTDDRLAARLVDELRRRDISPAGDCRSGGPIRSHVAMIGEWDSVYGRELAEAMSREFRKDGRCAGAVAESRWIHRFSYLRGLDGQIPTAGAKEGKDDAGGASAKAADGKQTERAIERAEGQGQFDYLRRLGDRLQDLDDALVAQGQGRVRAIGVVGGDVYDKLVVLQALRDRFPAALFFTTDLDARMLHPAEQAWARNLVVASNFGLQLAPALQGDIPPFRDGYQTSLYLSSLIALHNARRDCRGASTSGCITEAQVAGWLGDGRVFEIGRSRAFDFSPVDDASALACQAGTGLEHCARVQPGGSLPYPRPGRAVATCIAASAMVALLLLAWIAVTRPAYRSWVRRHRAVVRRGAFGLVAAAVLVTVFAGPLWSAVATWLTESGAGEPVAFFEGISIWPTQCIRLVAIVFSLAFVIVSWRMLAGNLDAMSKQLHFSRSRTILVRRLDAYYARQSVWRALYRMFAFRIDQDDIRHVPRLDLSSAAQQFWAKYIYQGRFRARFVRVLVASLAYTAVAAAVVFVFGLPATPSRGGRAWLVNLVLLWTSIGLMHFILFYVVDATVFCVQLINGLSRGLGERTFYWPCRALDDFAHILGIQPRAVVPNDPPGPAPLESEATKPAVDPAQAAATDLRRRIVESWLSIRFIAMRTRVVAALVYFPFVVISLMFLARNRAFDNWSLPLGLALVFAASTFIVSICAVMLRISAERARRKVLDLLGAILLLLKGREDKTAAQVELLMANIRGFREGAFAPYSQQPIFRALLLPLSTFGGSALFDWFNAASL